MHGFATIAVVLASFTLISVILEFEWQLMEY